jgi:hypothetical protein
MHVAMGQQQCHVLRIAGVVAEAVAVAEVVAHLHVALTWIVLPQLLQVELPGCTVHTEVLLRPVWMLLIVPVLV